MTTFHDDRRRRLWIRSIRRGMKEMDVILSDFAANTLAAMSEEALAAYEALLQENDQSLYAWILGEEDAPSAHATMIALIAAHVDDGLVLRRTPHE